MKRMEYPSNFQIYRAAIRTPIKTIPTKPLKMQKALGLHLWGMEQDHEIIPEPSLITDLKFAANQTPVQIDVFMPPVRKRMNGKKTI